MKKLTLLASTILVFGFFSCKKSNDTTSSSSSLPKTYTEEVRSSVLNELVVYNLTYDNKNRLISMAATPEPSIIKFVYQYPSDNTVFMDLYESGQLNIHEVIWLNSFSFFDSTFHYDDTQDTTTEKYFYDGNHLLTLTNEYEYANSVSSLSGQTQYTYDNNGNVLTQTDNTGTTSFTYYTDLPYNLTMGQPYINTPKYFIKTTSSNPSGTPLTTTHYYKFDSNNRLIQDSSYVTGIDAIAIKSYTY
jgi:YD repeat-containing protein